VLEERDLFRRATYRSNGRGRPRQYVLRNPALARADDENATIPLTTPHEVAGGVCVAEGCGAPGDITHDGDAYCVSHATTFGLCFNPLVEDVAVERSCEGCGVVFVASADSTSFYCRTCLESAADVEGRS
jgi:hypothetical protein